MATRRDPSQTTMLRRSFMREMRRRFGELRRAVQEAVVTQDVFGLVPGQPFAVNVERQEWRFQTDDQKLESFRRWFQRMVNEKILTTDQANRPWTGKYVESAYRKGTVRAFLDAQGKARKKSQDFYDGSKEEFLRSAFSQPERLSKVRLLATRSFEELRGVTATMASRMNRILAQGLAQGFGPRDIADAMSQSIRGLTNTRALVIARTEIIHAHAEGQLDSFEELGEDVGVFAEWATAGDDRVCPQCSALEGQIFKVAEARGLIPRHPNCRCAWIPAIEVAKRTRRKKVLRAVARSLKREGGRSKSAWVGKKLRG